MNLLLYDGEMTYVHTNMKETLFYKESDGSTVFATVPLDNAEWSPVPFTRLLAWQNGKLLTEGADHGHEYIYDPEDMKYLYLEHVFL